MQNIMSSFFFSKSKLTANLFSIRISHLTVTDIFIVLSNMITVLKTFVTSKVLKRDIREITITLEKLKHPYMSGECIFVTLLAGSKSA